MCTSALAAFLPAPRRTGSMRWCLGGDGADESGVGGAKDQEPGPGSAGAAVYGAAQKQFCSLLNVRFAPRAADVPR